MIDALLAAGVVVTRGSLLLALPRAAETARSTESAVELRNGDGMLRAVVCPEGRVYLAHREIPGRCPCCETTLLEENA